LLVGLLFGPGFALSQGTTRVRRIGLLISVDTDSPSTDATPDEDLRELGWVEGKNLHVERRVGRLEALNALADELVRAKVEVIVTQGTPETLAAMRATKTVPIVFSVGDPLALGLVKSLAQPGGNATGLSFASPEVETKELEVLKDLIPTIQRVGVFEPAAHPYFQATREQFDRSCRSLGLQPHFVEVATIGEIDAAMAKLAQQRVQIVILRGSSFVQHHAIEITTAALKHGLPTMAEQPDLVRDARALISYSLVLDEINRRRASYVDRILRGARPATLPIEQLTKFELVINLKTARTLGVTVPPSLLLRADEVIR
jgi:putative ABC transport system substrate-binding protein